MRNQNLENSQWWTYAIALTIILAGISAFMVVKRHELFPEMYNHAQPHGPNQTSSEDSTMHKSESH